MAEVLFCRRRWRTTISDMREEDLYTEQYFGDEHLSVADAPQWEQQALPTTRLNVEHRNPYLDSMTAKVLLGDYFDAGRLPPAEVVAAVRHQSWRDLEYKGGSLDVVGDRLYVLFFRSMCSKLSYVKIGRTKKEDKAQVQKRIMAHESEAKIAQAVLFDAWISRPCVSAVVWEKGVKAHLSAAAAEDIIPVEQVKAEYFRGIAFGTAVRVARRQEDRSGVVFLAP
ncbi:hypothetical protein [Streptomyces lavenduligriseus]|uniref:GIY-YIG nuclease family protein n=1 Tax=Streptomyces lavenduligriseus TaxID=67315 RepID=A0ABT0P5W7_9ACTN|nr:hypothetical protein [Streptomyces lavenduligriseus]MCL3998978.1 hypothetical protein [Streptomyces lavenduligriseus]